MRKKQFYFIFFGAIILSFFVMHTVSAAGLVNCKTDPCSWNDLYTLINDVIKFLIFTLGLPLVTVVIVVSGIELVLHPNNSTAQSVWRGRLRTALLGLVIMLTAFLIVKAIVWGLTGGENKVDPYDLRTILPDKTRQ